MEQPGKKRKLDEIFVNRRIESLTAYTITKEDGTEGTEMQWCGSLVEAVSDRSWAKTGVNGRRLKTCYKEGNAAHVYWDASEETDEQAQWQLIVFKPGLQNSNVARAQRFQYQTPDYGIKQKVCH